MSNAIDLQKKLPGILRSDFWKDLQGAISDELNSLKTEIEKKKSYYVPRDYDDSLELIAFSKSFGYDPNFILNTSLEYIQQEVDSIFYKIITKSTAKYYEYLFRLVPYIGRVYIVYYDSTKLIKYFDWASILASMNNHDLRTLFTSVVGETSFEKLFSVVSNLDGSPVLYLDDANNPWRLDGFINASPTSHIALEYTLNSTMAKGGVDYLITSDYFWYLEKASNYGRKASDVVNIGCQLNLLTNGSLWYDEYDVINSGYSFPDIKSNVSITLAYKTRTWQNPFVFDDTPDQPFDQSIPWRLDTSSVDGEPRIINELFYTYKVGIGSKSLYKSQFEDIFRDSMLLLSFDEPTGSSLVDQGLVGYTCTVNGTYSRVPAISGNAIQYNGSDVDVLVEDFLVANADTSIAFWIKDYDSQVNSTSILFTHPNYEFRLIDTSGVYSIECEITGATTSVVLDSGAFDSTTKEVYVVLERDYTNGEASLYLYYDNMGTALVDTGDTSGIGDTLINSDAYIGSDGSSSYYAGVIDELRAYQRLLGTDYRNYFYEDRIGGLYQLATPVYESDSISISEYKEDGDVKALSVSVPANDVNNEIIGTGDGAEDEFLYTTKYDIEPYWLTIKHVSGSTTYTTTDDGLGNLVGTHSQGTVNYDTGEISFTATKDTEVLREVLSETGGASITGQLENINTNSGTCELRFYISGSYYTVADNGAGSFVDSSILSSSINYTTGEYSITFNGSASNITINYVYHTSSIPNLNEDIKVDYRTATPTLYTEFGIFDIEGNMILYATFPPVEFRNATNHLTFNIGIVDR